MTYPILNLTVLAIGLIYLWFMRGWLKFLPTAGAAVVLLLLTAIFDNAIIGTGIVAYDQSLISGIKIGVAPIEDFAYTLLAVVLVPSLFNAMKARG